MSFVQYIKKEDRKVYYRDLQLVDGVYSLEEPISEDHLISAIVINGKRKNSTVLNPAEQALCTGILSVNLLQDNHFHNLNRNFEFKEDDLINFNQGVGGDLEIKTGDYLASPVFTASSYYNSYLKPENASLHAAGWGSSGADMSSEPGPFLILDFEQIVFVKSLICAPRLSNAQFVTSSNIYYSSDGVDYDLFGENVPLCSDKFDTVKIAFSKKTRYVKFEFTSWTGHCSGRFGAVLSFTTPVSSSAGSVAERVNLTLEEGVGGSATIDDLGSVRLLNFNLFASNILNNGYKLASSGIPIPSVCYITIPFIYNDLITGLILEVSNSGIITRGITSERLFDNVVLDFESRNISGSLVIPPESIST